MTNSSDGMFLSQRTRVRHSPAGTAIVEGIVVGGDRRGRELGFPTANLLISEDLNVADGVWAAHVDVGAARTLAAVSLGHRPTFYGATGVRLLEAHLLDFEGDLYGRSIEVRLGKLLRPQRTFANTISLIRQIRRDVDDVRKWQSVERGSHEGSRKPAVRDMDQKREQRSQRRRHQIAAAVQESIAQGEVSYERVAYLADVPVGFVRWAYPSECDLRKAASTVHVSHPF